MNCLSAAFVFFHLFERLLLEPFSRIHQENMRIDHTSEGCDLVHLDLNALPLRLLPTQNMVERLSQP